MAKIYGNPQTDGKAVHTAIATSTEYGQHQFQFYGPADVAEYRAMVAEDKTAAPLYRHLIEDLKTDARGAFWGDLKQANMVKVTVNGKVEKTSKAMAGALAALQAEIAKLTAAAKK